jgi:hypothetical protein
MLSEEEEVDAVDGAFDWVGNAVCDDEDADARVAANSDRVVAGQEEENACVSGKTAATTTAAIVRGVEFFMVEVFVVGSIKQQREQYHTSQHVLHRCRELRLCVCVCGRGTSLPPSKL